MGRFGVGYLDVSRSVMRQGILLALTVDLRVADVIVF
jgi:hypothetical protein